jgi:hypothetical protein
MSKQLVGRRLTGLLVLAILWATLWMPAGFLIALNRARYLHCTDDACPLFTSYVIPFALWTGAIGASAGISFGLVLAIVEGGRTVGQLAVRRLALWGTFSGVVIAAGVLALRRWQSQIDPLESIEIVLVRFMVLGAVAAIATLALARRRTSGGVAA